MIVCLGTTPAKQRTMVFDSLKIDAVNRAVSVSEYASGKSINAARVIHTLGEKCIATGFLGDQSGEFCGHDLDAAGIGHDFVKTSAATRICITVIDRGGATATELVQESHPVTNQEVDQLLQKLGALLRGAKVLILSGTLAPGCGDDFYARCVRLAQTMRVKTILDARGAPMKSALSHRPTLVKPNRSELALTLNRSIDSQDDLLAAMREIVSLGAAAVAVTNGPGETFVHDGGHFWKIQTPAVRAISPIGSGDAFAGGAAVGIVRGLSIAESCQLAVACGAANAMTKFAGHVLAEDVELLRSKVEIAPI